MNIREASFACGKKKQKSPNFAMLSQKFAILDSKISDVREVGLMWQKENKNHRISRCCLKNSRFWIQNSRCSRGWLRMWQKETKNSVCRDAVSKIRDQHVGPAHFLVQQCQSPISTVLLPKLFDMHRATKAFGTTITSTDFRNICQKNRQIAQLRVRFPKTQKWPVEIAMKTRNVANSAKTNDICFPVQRREKEKCNLRKKKK